MLPTICRALGRLSSDDLAELEATEAKPDGTCELRVTGQSSRHSGFGVWDLVVDPTNGHLVRSGTFGPRHGEPTTKFRSTGTRRFGGVVLAERGELVERPGVISVRLISFSPAVDLGLIEEARKVIGRAQSRLVQVLDYRDHLHPQPHLVPAGELDLDK